MVSRRVDYPAGMMLIVRVTGYSSGVAVGMSREFN